MVRKTLTLATLIFVIGVTVATTTPVFLWGANSLSKAALQTISQDEFAKDVAAPLLKNSMIVVFLENNLSSNDFLCSKAESSDSCYAFLKDVRPKTHYPSVEEPIEALLSVANEKEYNSVDQSGQLDTPLQCANGKVVFVSLAGLTEEDRASTLESHDAAISAITKEISCPVAYMYMSTQQTAVKSRQRRDAVGDTGGPLGGNVFRHGSDFLLFYTKLYYISGKTRQEIVISSMSVVNGTSSSADTPPKYFTVTLQAENAKSVQFNMTKSSSGYFSMGNVLYDGVYYRTTPEISAPFSFSFSCGNLTLGVLPSATPSKTGEINTDVLSWQYLQFQAPFGQTNNASFVFGDAWSCTGFFTAGILMGLFVVLIMLIILFTGICWMMDINTMDRFDDPKGKTITINAVD